MSCLRDYKMRVHITCRCGYCFVTVWNCFEFYFILKKYFMTSWREREGGEKREFYLPIPFPPLANAFFTPALAPAAPAFLKPALPAANAFFPPLAPAAAANPFLPALPPFLKPAAPPAPNLPPFLPMNL